MSFNIPFKLLALTLSSLFIATLFVALQIPVLASADPIGREECYPAVLLLRGSGEAPVPDLENAYIPANSTTGEPFIDTNGYEGETIQKLLQAFVDNTNPAETVSRVRFIDIYYPAFQMFDEEAMLPSSPDMYIGNLGQNFDASVREGSKNIVDFIKADEARFCDTKYMVVGYSQGAMSIRGAYQLLKFQTNKIISSYVIGDPVHNGDETVNSPTQYSAANTGGGDSGLFRLLGGVVQTLPPSITAQDAQALADYSDEMEQSDELIYRVGASGDPYSRSVCHQYDIFCSFSRFAEAITQEVSPKQEHTNYFDSSTVAGSIDLQYEVVAFDEQVQYLADHSTTISPNPPIRSLASTVTVLGSPTVYNVVNARAGDLCSWDENSDNTFEVVDVPCGTYEAVHLTSPAKMSVTLVDSFDIEYQVSSEKLAVKPEYIHTDPTLGIVGGNAYFMGSTEGDIEVNFLLNDGTQSEQFYEYTLVDDYNDIPEDYQWDSVTSEHHHSVANLTPNTAYYAAVREVSPLGIRSPYKVIKFFTLPATAEASTILIDEESALVEWDNFGSYSEYYDIFRNGDYITTVDGTSNNYLDETLGSGTEYTYSIFGYALNPDGSVEHASIGIDTNSVMTTGDPDEPSELLKPNTPTIDAVSSNSLTIVWGELSSPIVGYEIYRDYSYYDTVYDISEFEDNDVSSNTSYSYMIRAFDDDGNYSPLSDELVVTTLVAVSIPVQAPTNLTVDYMDAYYILFSWSSSDENNELSYVLYRDGQPLPTGDYYADATTGADFYALPNSSHTYKVRAEDSNGNFLFSEPLVVTTPEED